MVVKASTSNALSCLFELRLDSIKNFLMVMFAVFLFGALREIDCVEKNRASSLFVSWGKAFNGIPPPLFGGAEQFFLRYGPVCARKMFCAGSTCGSEAGSNKSFSCLYKVFLKPENELIQPAFHFRYVRKLFEFFTMFCH